MAQRHIAMSELHEALGAATCSPDAAAAGSAPRWRCVGRTKAGRQLIIIIAGTPHTGTIVTVFEP
jgi:hypothetical protein